MELAIATNFLESAGDVEPVLRMIADAGFSHLLWGHHWNDDLTYSACEIGAIRRLLKKYRLTLQDVHGSCSGEQNWFAVGEPQRRAGVLLVKNRLKMMTALQATGALVMHQPRIEKKSSAEEIEVKRLQYQSLRRSLDELMPLLEKLGTRIALENLPRDNWEFLHELLNDYPAERIGLCFDSGHANLKVRRHYADVNARKDRIIAIHLHDNDGSGDQHRPPFMGSVNWNRVAGLLRTSGYRGVPTFEVMMWDTPYWNPELPVKKQPPAKRREFLADAYARCLRVAELCCGAEK